MKLSLSRFSAGVVLILASLAGGLPTASAQTNLALTATASNSSSWEDGTAFDATKANDGDPGTRWNARGNDAVGSWVALNWANDVTFNKVAVDEDFNRVREFELQVPEGDDWKTIYTSAGTNINPTNSGTPTYTVLFTTPVTTKGLRFLITQTTTVPSIFEIRVYGGVGLGTLSGKVTDAQSNPLEGASVVVTGGPSAATDAQGNYSMSVEAGTFDVTASKAAFRSRTTRNVAFAADATKTQDFSLLPLPTNLALTATAASSTDYSPDYDAAKANDGDLGTRWNSAGGDRDGSWISLTWDSEQEFNTVTIRESLGRIADFTLQKWDETAVDYVDIIHQTPGALPTDTDRVLTVTLPADVKAKELRILVNTARELPTIYEIEVAKSVFATLSGVVKDVASGQPIADAQVTIDPFGIVTTDAQGKFSAQVVPNEYLVQARAAGYFESELKVVAAETNAPGDVTLLLPATGPNLAQGATATASSELVDVDPAFPATNVNDGDVATSWKPGLNEETGDPLTTDQWVGVTFDQPKTFNVIVIDWGTVYPIVQKSNFQYMDANGQWVDVPDTVFNPETYYVSGKPARFVLPQPLTTKGVRYFINFTNGVKAVPEVPELQLFSSPIGGGTGGGGCLGNVTDDSAVDVQDAVAILRHVVNLGDPLTGQKLTNANVNGDAGVDVQDAVIVLQAIVDIAPGNTIITNLACGGGGAEDLVFDVPMNAANEVPAPSGNPQATGTARVTVKADGSSVIADISTAGSFTSTVTAGHIHIITQPNGTGPVVFGLYNSGSDGVWSGHVAKTFTADNFPAGGVAGIATFADAVAMLRAGKGYVNFHTTTNGAGEIRGNLVTAEAP